MFSFIKEAFSRKFLFQNNLDGISVPGILEWAGPVPG